jgi:hypothetical protein
MNRRYEEIFNRQRTQDDRERTGPLSTKPGASHYGHIEENKSSGRNSGLQKDGYSQGGRYKHDGQPTLEERGCQPASAGVAFQVNHEFPAPNLSISFLDVTSLRETSRSDVLKRYRRRSRLV